MKRILWTRDELILVLDLYLNNRKTSYKLPTGTLARYSSYLKKIHGIEKNDSSDIRSPESVEIRLRNYASLDPYWLAQGKKGLQNSETAAFREIWAEFHEHPEDVSEIANEIKRALSSNDYILPKTNLDERKAKVFEGKQQLRSHYSRERKSQRKAKLKAFMASYGSLFCEVCDDDYANYDEEVRAKVFEVHHNVPLAIAFHQVGTRLDDLSVLCANCHRAIHAYEEVPTVQQMREMLISNEIGES